MGCVAVTWEAHESGGANAEVEELEETAMVAALTEAFEAGLQRRSGGNRCVVGLRGLHADYDG